VGIEVRCSPAEKTQGRDRKSGGGGRWRRSAGFQLGPTAAAGASEAGRRLGQARHGQGGGAAGRFGLDWPMGFGGPGWAGAGRAFRLGPLA
jgi:hypothetical protein